MWMTRDLVTVSPDDDVAEAALAMSRHQVRRVLVTRPGALGVRLVGIASVRDVARGFPPDVNPLSASALRRPIGRTLGGVMSAAVETRTPGTPIQDAPRRRREAEI